MLAAILLALFHAFTGTAQAADVPTLEEAELWAPLTYAQEEESAEDKQAARLAALEAAQAAKAARVIVLSWKDAPDVNFENETLTRNVKTRIARADAKFFPEADLYQQGRKEGDPSVTFLSQRGSVPDSAIDTMLGAVAEVAPIPWNGMSESDWGLKAQELRKIAEHDVWFIDRVELREPLFLLYVQIGRAAENQNYAAPPFYEQIGGQTVNYYWYLAGLMAWETPDLMSKITDQDLYGSIQYYKDSLDNGAFKELTLGFEVGTEKWDPKKFAEKYVAFINGLEVLIDDPESLHKTYPGRVDIFLQRADSGYGLSDSVSIDKFENKIYFVREVARKKMGIDFIDQLFEHPNECTPELDGDILNYLSIYAKLHTEAEVYIAVPEAGNPNKVLIWRYDRMTGVLQKVLDGASSFPVRFAAMFKGGFLYNTASAYISQEDVDSGTFTPGEVPSAEDFASAGIELGDPAIPVGIELRGHYGRLVVRAGVDWTFKPDGLPWQDNWHNLTSPVDENGDAVPIADREFVCDVGDCADTFEEVMAQRNIWFGAGIVLMRDAAIGFGPSISARVGFTDVPNAVQPELNVGYAIQMPGIEAGGRVRPFADAQLRGGASIPLWNNSIYRGSVAPVFGIEIGVGITL